MRLLLAEDERALSKALKTILERNNYSVDAFYDGQEALEYLQADNYGGVILDINDITVSGGTFDIKSGDDAIHSDTNVNIQNGDFTISYCYEGIEGNSITIDNGSFNITAVDDGINAAGDDKSDIFITINGGTFVIVSSGDCIDSNNSLTLNGGSLNLTCNGNGNTALDCDGSYSNNGADVTTNDGSENNPGQMGGQGGFGGKGGMGFRGMN